jgi:esterase/lipase
MGATAALLYCIEYRPADVVLSVIDSPFYSFDMVAFEIASKNVKAPDFVISFALEMAKKNCEKFQYNPFEIVLEKVGECTTPALFVYCEEDNVINCQNTHLICNHYQAVFEKLIID